MKVDGNEFRNGAGFIHSLQNDLPQIGLISDIYVLDKKNLVFKAFNYVTVYHPHFHAYSLSRSSSGPTYYCYDKLVLSKPIHIRQPRSLPHHDIVVMPYHV